MKLKLTIVVLLLAVIVQAQTLPRYSIVISEVMADPTPVVGLPNSEFIELKNTSAQTINLNGWKLGDGTGIATITANFNLQPDSAVILCSNSSVAAFTGFGNVIGVTSFPSLDNDGELIFLRSPQGVTMHAVEYNKSWYNNAVKSEGGWSLEMIDTKNPCSGSTNWNASTAIKGGTPGKKNSVEALNKDNQPPAVLRAYATDSITAIIVFNEPLDSASAVKVASYTISDGISLSNTVTALPPLFNKVQLKLAVALQRNKVYELTINSVTDCSGTSLGGFNKTRLGLASLADTTDIVINEVLFNPKPDGYDYVELYNRSSKIVDLLSLYIANRSSTGAINSLKQLSEENRLLFPGNYMVITEAADALQKQYLVKDEAAVVTVSAMPSYPDDKGTILLLNATGKIIDELKYEDDWHFKLLDNKEGVALERINYNERTQNKSNWHSAATSAGYGTPGYQNSQYAGALAVKGTIMVAPPVFSPDNDGTDDWSTIQYQFEEPGYVCNITVFDANGKPVRYLARNAVCGLQGNFRWDGLDENFKKLPIGTYVVLTDVFTVNGKTKRFKNAITLARRF